MSSVLNKQTKPAGELNKAFCDLSSHWQAGQSILDTSLSGGRVCASEALQIAEQLREANENYRLTWRNLLTEVELYRGRTIFIFTPDYEALERFHKDNNGVGNREFKDFLLSFVTVEEIGGRVTSIRPPDCSNHSPFNLSSLVNLRALKELRLHYHLIAESTEIARLTGLESLSLSSSNANLLSGLQHLKLRKLKWGRHIDEPDAYGPRRKPFDFKPFGKLNSLEKLEIAPYFIPSDSSELLRQRRILFSDFSPLKDLPSLNSLSLFWGIIKDVARKNIPALNKLTFFECEVKDATFIGRMEKLSSLKMEHCVISGEVTQFPESLNEISFYGSDLKDLEAALSALLQLSSLKSVEMRDLKYKTFSSEERKLIERLRRKKVKVELQ